MNFSEFIQRLGEDPGSQDPAFLRARNSSPEFMEAAAHSDRFEIRLRQALEVKTPESLLRDLAILPDSALAAPSDFRPIWRNYAVAAGVLLLVALAGITFRINVLEPSVKDYVAKHYAYDGPELVVRGEGHLATNIAEVLDSFGMGLTPEFAATVSFIKFCPTPEGLGAHLIVNTPGGPVTVLFMPDLKVEDGQLLEFDGMQAQLVNVNGGAAAIIGTPSQQVANYHSLVQQSFVPLVGGA